MKSRILVADSDSQVLSIALGPLREEGYQVIAECGAKDALSTARQWLPDVIIISSACLHAWSASHACDLQTMLPASMFIVTASAPEDLQYWSQRMGDRCDVLLKPLVHSFELLAAVEATELAHAADNNPGMYQSQF